MSTDTKTQEQFIREFTNAWGKSHYRFSMGDQEAMESLKQYTLSTAETCPVEDLDRLLVIAAFCCYLETRLNQGFRLSVESENGNYDVLPVFDGPIPPTWATSQGGQA